MEEVLSYYDHLLVLGNDDHLLVLGYDDHHEDAEEQGGHLHDGLLEGGALQQLRQHGHRRYVDEAPAIKNR